MPNDYFQFKQFTIHQQKTAMKVCTDACLFGAWVAEKIQNSKVKDHNLEEPVTTALESESTIIKHILDIGAGTGLLSLMLAQKTFAHIDAVEIDANAAGQAKENIAASDWRDKIEVHHSSIQTFEPAHTYDFIITNPPFFQDDLKSDDSKRNLALHSEALSLEDLLKSIERLLSANGSFAILLPFHRSNFFEQLALQNHFFLAEKVLVKQTEKHQPFRSMLLFSNKATTFAQREIIIKQQGEYSAAFIDLLKDYYLYL